MEINCYGETCAGTPMMYRLARTPLETKVIGGITYNRFSDGENAIIHRLGVGEDGLIEHKWARGAWDKAESLVYDKEIDETMEVDA